MNYILLFYIATSLSASCCAGWVRTLNIDVTADRQTCWNFVVKLQTGGEPVSRKRNYCSFVIKSVFAEQLQASTAELAAMPSRWSQHVNHAGNKGCACSEYRCNIQCRLRLH
jgi:hypothetical protein